MQLHTKLPSNKGRIGSLVPSQLPSIRLRRTSHALIFFFILPPPPHQFTLSTSDVVFRVPPFLCFSLGKWPRGWRGRRRMDVASNLTLRLAVGGRGTLHDCEVFLTTSRPFTNRDVPPFQLTRMYQVPMPPSQSLCQNSAPPWPGFCVWHSNTSLNWNQ